MRTFTIIKLIYFALLGLNLISFFLFWLDKQKAKKHQQRIPERTLLFTAFLFGSLGALLGMILCHHKTRKIKFMFLVPLFLVLHSFILFIL